MRSFALMADIDCFFVSEKKSQQEPVPDFFEVFRSIRTQVNRTVWPHRRVAEANEILFRMEKKNHFATKVVIFVIFSLCS
jgi:hypothetical protein